MIAILMVLCGSWFDAGDAVSPSPAPRPEPVNPPADVCQCGCGKAGCKCGKVAAVSGCAAVKAGPVLSINDAAIESIKPAPRTLVTIYSPTWHCPPCAAMKADAELNHWKDGDADIEIKWVVNDQPPGVTGFPWIVSGNQIFRGQRNMQQIRAWLGLPLQPTVKAVSSVRIGTIDGAAINSFLDSIPETGVIEFGGAKVTIPPRMATQIDVSRVEVKVAFTGTKPKVSYGSGWLSVSRSVSHVAVNRGTVVVGVDGFPDLVLAVR